MSSCGVITKTRYGNGYKLNLGELFSKDGDVSKTSNVKRDKKRSSIVGASEYSYPLETDISHLSAIIPPANQDKKDTALDHTVTLNKTGIKVQSGISLSETSRGNNLGEIPSELAQSHNRSLHPYINFGMIFFIIGLAFLYFSFAGIFNLIFLLIGVSSLIGGIVMDIKGIISVRNNLEKYSGRGLAIFFALISSLILLFMFTAVLFILIYLSL